MEQTNPEVIREVERRARAASQPTCCSSPPRKRRCRNGGGDAQPGRSCDGEGIMESLEPEDPDLVEQIRRLMFVFEDILLVNDKGIQAGAQGSGQRRTGAGSRRRRRRNSRRRSSRTCRSGRPQLIKEDMEYMGPVRVATGLAADRGRRATTRRRGRDHHLWSRRRERHGTARAHLKRLYRQGGAPAWEAGRRCRLRPTRSSRTGWAAGLKRGARRGGGGTGDGGA